MERYLNGYSSPKFVIRDAETNVHVETFILDYETLQGKQEDYSGEFDITHIGGDFSKNVYTRDKRIVFTMDYSGHTNANNSMKINSIMNYWEAQDDNGIKLYKIILYPFEDNPYRFFEVNYTGESFSWSPMTGAIGRSGDRIINWKWETKYLVKRDWQTINVDLQVVAFPMLGRRAFTI